MDKKYRVVRDNDKQLIALRETEEEAKRVADYLNNVDSDNAYVVEKNG